ncbi:MAG TPA: alpha/beta hydrolase [Steroidobacteraceae bacterium]|jgi:pimeloyl-ACP methyl ester carboxylesterase
MLKWTGFVIACLIFIAITSALSYRKYLQHNVAQERAITAANGIDSLERVRIAGIDQWIQVRGQDVKNPILLILHGGPGVAFIPLGGAFETPWEKRFTVVNWDQRGAGKTYASNAKELQRRTMTVAQMEQDTLEVARYLAARFKRQKIFVLGHSWGSILGLWLAHEHPEVVYAYVGVGQLVNARENEATAYQDALQKAHELHHQRGIAALEALAPYPAAAADLAKSGIARGWEAKFLGPPAGGGNRFIDDALPRLISAPEYSVLDDYAFIRGMRFSLEVLIPQMMSVELAQLGSEFRVPIFFLEGRYDPYCRPELIFEYSQRISAPQKDFVWFEVSGHFPFFDEPQKFADELSKIRSVAAPSL